ncbi:MAG: histidine phosphatase family protein [Nanoarchaeota archaeon]|nr:histidine phosphatase family protein [Nanoarchaeota archaeon]
MTKLIVVRHCQTEDNAAGKMQGYHNDSCFTEEGKIQAQKLLDRLKSEPIKAVYCSDLGRAFKTAEAIASAHGLKPIQLQELRECDIGDWRDLPVKEGIGKWIEYYETQKKKGIKREIIRPPNGENSFDHQVRVKKAVKRIVAEHPNDVVVIVGHSGTNRVIVGSFENKDPDEFYNVGQSNACINIIETDENHSKIISVNDTRHLENGTN